MSAREPASPTGARRRLRALRTRLPPADGSEPVPTPRRPFQPPLRAAAALEALNAAGWAGAEPRHLVALYAYLHGQVYGVAPDELTGDPLAWLGAVSAATKLLKDEFGDGVTIWASLSDEQRTEMVRRAVEWVRWVWVREQRGCDRRAKVGETSEFRIGWRYMFCRRGLVVDYRRALAAAKERAR